VQRHATGPAAVVCSGGADVTAGAARRLGRICRMVAAGWPAG